VRLNSEGKPILAGGRVTGFEEYRLIDIKTNLGLSEDYLHSLPKSAKILSVGEGNSELASNLRERFPDTKALDLWYDDKNLTPDLAKFVAENRPHLITGSSTNLPMPDQSVDLVLSHMLLNNLDEGQKIKSVYEMVRVLKLGGEARIAFGDHFNRDIEGLLRAVYGSDISVTTKRWISNWQTGVKDHPGQTLIIRRLRGDP
jgi:ubiquinone/menaquinone biosynthesis C-methylase UbiE